MGTERSVAGSTRSGRFRISLRWFLVITTVIGWSFGIVAKERRISYRDRIFKAKLEEGGCYVEYKDPYSRVDHTPFARAPSLWDKIAYRIGGQRVGYVFVHSCNDKFSLQYVTELDNIEALDIPLFPNGELSLLARLDSLIYLNLDGTPIVDLSPLSKLENLQVLRLCDTPIRDVRPLLGLKNLKHLYLNNTVVTDEQVREIRDVLPNCEVHYSFRFSDEPLVPQVFNSS